MTRTAEPIAVLLELTHRLGEDRTLEESLRAVTEAALQLVPGDHASVRLLDATKMALLSGARSGTGTSHVPLEFSRGEGMLGWAVQHKRALVVADTDKDPRFVKSEAQGFQIRSLVVEPLWSSGEIIGVLSVSSAEPHAFDRDSQLKVRLLANCSVPPIEKARLLRLAIVDDLTLAYNVRHLAPRLRRRWRTRGATMGLSAFSCSTSITSRGSMTSMGMPPATSSCVASPTA